MELTPTGSTRRLAVGVDPRLENAVLAELTDARHRAPAAAQGRLGQRARAAAWESVRDRMRVSSARSRSLHLAMRGAASGP